MILILTHLAAFVAGTFFAVVILFIVGANERSARRERDEFILRSLEEMQREHDVLDGLLDQAEAK